MRRFYVAATLLLFVCGTAIYLWRVPNDPPGFYIDESSICYNAHVLSQTGHDEYGVTLALLTYSYSIGRLLGPLLALGLLFLVSAGRWHGLLKVWVTYATLLVPLLVFHESHPGALTNRFKSFSYLTSG